MADHQRTCDKCGKPFTSDGAWFAKHALKCEGTPASTRGRIDRLARRPATKRAVVVDRTPPAVETAVPNKRKPAMPRKKTKSKRAHLPARKAERAAPHTQPTEDRSVLIAARDTLLPELHRKRDAINAAIAGLEALA